MILLIILLQIKLILMMIKLNKFIKKDGQLKLILDLQKKNSNLEIWIQKK